MGRLYYTCTVIEGGYLHVHVHVVFVVLEHIASACRNMSRKVDAPLS